MQREFLHRGLDLFENHHTVMLLVDSTSGTILDANPAAERFYGWSREQLATKRFRELDAELMHGAPLPSAMPPEYAGHGRRGRHRLASGEVRDVEVFAGPVEAEGRSLSFAVVHDMTDRALAESALHLNDRLLRMAGTLAHFGGWSIDLAAGKVLWSDEVCAIHEVPPGYSPRLQDGINFYAPEWRARLTEIFAACARDGTPYDEEMEIITARGRRAWVRAIAIAIRDGSGRVTGVQGAFQDINARKMAEKELAASEARYRALFENMTAGFVLFEVVEDERGAPVDLRVLAANRGFEAVTGLRTDQLLGQRLTVVLPGIERDDTDWIGTYGRVALTGESREFERYSAMLDRHYSIGAFRSGDRRCAVTFVDITERKRADQSIRELNEQLRRHADELERRVAERTAELERAKVRAEAADQAKSAFLATMSHELRTPLNAIIGFTEVLLNRIPGPLNEEQARQLAIVRQSSKHLFGLISDVLDISRVESGKLHLAQEPFDLRELLARVGGTFRAEAHARGLELRLDLGGRDATIVGDRRRVEQVLNNLLSNALKFTLHGAIDLRLEAGDDSISITVADTGVGIRPADLEKLFRPFSQVETGLPGDREGTGLGLSISKLLVEAMGGRISVESAWGEGSRFRFTLPAGGDARPQQ